jgi:hypothetical protein
VTIPITHPTSAAAADRTGLAEALGRRAEINREQGAGFSELLSDVTARLAHEDIVAPSGHSGAPGRGPQTASVDSRGPQPDVPAQAADAARQAIARAAERYAAAAAARTGR